MNIIIDGYECEVKPFGNSEFLIMASKMVNRKEFIAIEVYDNTKLLEKAKGLFRTTLRLFKQKIEGVKNRNS